MGVTFSYCQEVSVYDAGNLDSQSPYGLTDNETKVLIAWIALLVRLWSV